MNSYESKNVQFFAYHPIVMLMIHRIDELEFLKYKKIDQSMIKFGYYL